MPSDHFEFLLIYMTSKLLSPTLINKFNPQIIGENLLNNRPMFTFHFNLFEISLTLDTLSRYVIAPVQTVVKIFTFFPRYIRNNKKSFQPTPHDPVQVIILTQIPSTAHVKVIILHLFRHNVNCRVNCQLQNICRHLQGDKIVTPRVKGVMSKCGNIMLFHT